MIKPIIIVVEGITDKQFLESFLPYEIVTTNGSDVPKKTIEYLKNICSARVIIILTDPDGPGEKIRGILNAEIPSALNVFIEKKNAIKNKKVGVAETKKEFILESLKNVIPNYVFERKETITISELNQLGLVGSVNSKDLREDLCSKLHLGEPNAKTLLKRLNALGLAYNDIVEVLK